MDGRQTPGGHPRPLAPGGGAHPRGAPQALSPSWSWERMPGGSCSRVPIGVSHGLPHLRPHRGWGRATANPPGWRESEAPLRGARAILGAPWHGPWHGQGLPAQGAATSPARPLEDKAGGGECWGGVGARHGVAPMAPLGTNTSMTSPEPPGSAQLPRHRVRGWWGLGGDGELGRI